MSSRSFALVATTLVLATGLAHLPTPAGAAPPNLLQNGSFEEDADMDLLPDGWTPFGELDSVGRAGLLTPRHGAWALEVADATNATPGGIQSYVVPVKPGDHLVVTFWTILVAYRPSVTLVKAPVSTVGLQFAGLDLPLSGPHVSVGVPDNKAWTPVQFDVIVPHGVDGVSIRIDPRGPVVMRVDDVSVVRVAHDGNYLPNPSFETGHFHNMPDLWPIPCGSRDGIWLKALTHGAHSLYFLESGFPTCDRALSVPFVLPPGQYRLTGDRYLIGSDGRVDVFVYDAAGGPGKGAPLAAANLTVKDLGNLVFGHEVLDFCAPAGAAKAQVLLTAPRGNSPVFWDNLRLVRTGAC